MNGTAEEGTRYFNVCVKRFGTRAGSSEACVRFFTICAGSSDEVLVLSASGCVLRGQVLQFQLIDTGLKGGWLLQEVQTSFSDP